MDVLTQKQRSYCMSQIRGKNTKPEIALRKALWAAGYRYRLHYKLPGRPDIVLVKQKIAVFVDGCFWHGCPIHGVKPKTNKVFWRDKIGKNMERDRRTDRQLIDQNWMVLRFWEHEIKQDMPSVLQAVIKAAQRGAR